MSLIETFALDEEDRFRAWLDAQPRAVVLWRGAECEFSEAYQPHFARLDGEGPALAQRWVEHGAEGPVGDRHRLELTPTLVAYRRGREIGRLEAELGVGIRPEAALAWSRGLPVEEG